MTALLRDFTCAVCGAPRRTTEGALVVLCRHCGAILTFSGDGLWHPTALAERHEAGIAQLVKPSAAQARLMAITLEMAQLTAPEHRERWRLLAEEQAVAMAIAYPAHGRPMPEDPAARRRHIESAVVMSELVTFDPRISGLMRAYSAAASQLTSGDPVGAARQMLEAARAYYRALEAHPQMPPGALREGASHLAKELVRSGITGYASLLGDRTTERIRVEVLGDEEGAAVCPRCGGPLDAPASGLVRCRHCDAVTNVEGEDAWTTAQLGLWEISKKELVRRDQLDGPTPGITAVGGFLHTGARDVPPEKAFAFLRRAIPWVATPDVLQGLDLLAHSATPAQAALLGALRAHVQSTWIADASQRPARPAARADFPSPTPADEAAWIESALGLWSVQRGDLLVLLSYPLNGMQVATVHEQATGISPGAAVRFFERAWPGFDRAAMADHLRRMAPAYDHPRMKAFTAELLVELQRRT